MNKEAIIDKIMQYQEDKALLVPGLIPEKIKLTRDEITDEALNRIIKEFRTEEGLGVENCLHCLKYSACNDCRYSIYLKDCNPLVDKLRKTVDREKMKELTTKLYENLRLYESSLKDI